MCMRVRLHVAGMHILACCTLRIVMFVGCQVSGGGGGKRYKARRIHVDIHACSAMKLAAQIIYSIFTF